jgi:uncharacterized protein DUF6457
MLRREAPVSGSRIRSAPVDEWLTRVADAVAGTAGVPRADLELDDDTIVTLLDLARIAAHESGNRVNAPLLCYLLGRAQGAAPLEPLADAVRDAS